MKKGTIQKGMTTHFLHQLLQEILRDLTKADRGNKTAAQRVRTRTIQFEKVAKMYRKESLLTEKKSAKAKAKPAPKAVAKVAPKTAAKPVAKVGAKTFAKVKPIEVKVVAPKRPTAKLPSKKR